MSNLGTEFRVGIFTLLGLVATCFAVFVLNPDIFEREQKKQFYTILKDAAGIMPKTHVKTNGVTVGKVLSVQLHTNSTKVVIEIREDVKVPRGSTIEIRTVGFLGDKFLEIKRVDESLGLIDPGGMIPRSPDTADLNEVIALVGSIAKDIKKVTANFAAVLGDEEGKQTLDNIVKNIEDITHGVKGVIDDNREDFASVISNLKVFTTNLNDVLDEENKEKFDRIIAAFDDSMIEVKGATKSINLIAEKVERGEGTRGILRSSTL